MRWRTAIVMLLVVGCRSDKSPPAPPTPGSDATINMGDAASGSAVPPTTTPSTVTPGVELAEAPLVGAERVDGLVADVAMSPTALTVRGKQVTLATLAPAIEALLDKTHPSELVLAIDRRITIAQLVEVLEAARKTAFERYSLLARSGSHEVMVPIYSWFEPGAFDIKLTVDGEQLRVWSGSGEEGTQAAPKLAIDLAAPGVVEKLSTGLAEIVARRWPADKDRRMKDESIAITLPRAMTLEAAMPILVTARKTADGKPLFPLLGIFVTP